MIFNFSLKPLRMCSIKGVDLNKNVTKGIKIPLIFLAIRTCSL